MGQAFPELESQQTLIEKVIKEEEEAFLRTLSTGIKLLDDIITKAQKEKTSEINGKDAFILYDTYGFPFDLTELIARENKLNVNEKEFAVEMEAQKSRSRNAAAQETDDWIELLKIEKTDFVGYDLLETEIRIARYRKVTQKKKTYYQLVFNRTPFYGESGGQVGDTGYIESEGVKTRIFDTQKENNLTVHLVEKMPEKPEECFLAVVDSERRANIANNHTATHLLHAALREVLGTHVEQKGSLVNASHLRFDFSHFQKMTDEEIAKTEWLVNQKIRKNSLLEENRNAPIEEAQKAGAMMLFGEKYGESVRTIRFGESLELCGGTHVAATGKIGMLKIISESAIAAGVRRIEAITAGCAEKYVNDRLAILQNIQDALKSPKDVLSSVTTLIQQNSDLSKKIEGFQQENLKTVKANLKDKLVTQQGINIIATKVQLDNAALIKDLAFQLKGEIENLFLVLGAEINGRPNLSVMISENLVKEKGLNAGQIVREAGKAIKGGGGGQPFYATAGGKDVAGLEAAIEKALSAL